MDHEPGWSAYPLVGGHSNNTTVQNSVQPLCLKYGVQFVISGHNHYYSRANVNNVMHITTGGGGAPLYTPSQREHIVKMDKSYHFCKLNIENNKLKLTAIRSDGTIIESLDYAKSSDAGVYLTPNELLAKPQEANQLNADAYPLEFAKEKISWSSDNNLVATVNETGLVTGIADGKATISASIQGGTKTASTTIKVIAYSGNLEFDNCDTTTNWSGSKSKKLSLITADFKEGTASIQYAGTGTIGLKKEFETPFNSGATLTNGLLKFWYYISDITKMTKVSVELSTGKKSKANTLNWSILGLKNGWNQLSLSFKDATVIGSPDLKSINSFRIYATKAKKITTRIDGIQLGPKALFSGLEKTTPKPEKYVKIYPNPNNSDTHLIEFPGYELNNKISLKITNKSGQIIYRNLFHNTLRKEIKLSEISNDSIYKIITEVNKVTTEDKLLLFQ